MSKNTGGPAFPTTKESRMEICSEGMTLRDYFAAKAVAGIFYPAIVESLAQDIDLDCDKIAGFAYTMADAMIAEREKE